MSSVVDRERPLAEAATADARLTANDSKRLRALLWYARRMGPHDRGTVRRLENTLDHALIITPEAVPPDVVTINSRVRFRTISSGQTTECSLVFPSEASVFDGKLSLLSPVGAALLGRRVGEKVACRTPGGEAVLHVLAVLAQPEATGRY